MCTMNRLQTADYSAGERGLWKMYGCGGCSLPGQGFRLCARCRSVRFCSRTCQKAAWPEHKKVCRKREDAAEPSTLQDPSDPDVPSAEVREASAGSEENEAHEKVEVNPMDMVD